MSIQAQITRVLRIAAVSCGAALGALLLTGACALAAPVTIDGTSAANVSATAADMQAQVNPNGASATYYFQYGTQAGVYTTNAPAPPGNSVPPGTTDQLTDIHVQGLQSGIAYHYRVVVLDAGNTLDGPDHSFTTQPATSAAGMPDGRAYELVSPPSKHGGEADGIDSSGEPPSPAQTSEDGSAITYGMKIPPGANLPGNPGNQFGGDQLVSTHGPQGWSTQDITPPFVEAIRIGLLPYNELLAFSPDLSHSIVIRGGAENIRSSSPEAPNVELLPFLRGADGGYQPLATGEFSRAAEIGFQGASPDLRHLIIGSTEALLPGVRANHGESPSLYEWAEGRLQLVSVLPNGEQADVEGGGSGDRTWLGNYRRLNTRHAISDDGSHVIWSSEGQLYERNMLTGQTVEVGGGEFQTASSDGSKVFTSPAPEPSGDLYEFDDTTDRLTDIVPGGEVIGVLGASEDGSYVYFVGEAALAGGATAGQPNLYMLHDNEERGTWEAPKFIATLAGSEHDEGEATDLDKADWESNRATGEGGVNGLVRQTARVSPDGRYVAFMSKASPTGYDNVDANTGARDAEVYLFDAQASRLVCASCNPTGARPVGGSEVPGWTAVANGLRTFYQSRYLSDEGRLFFDSLDALVPQDTNGKKDVYEYEPDGLGSCGTTGGCVGLISGGAEGNSISEGSTFVDASVSGDDVFIRTLDRLVPQDVDNAYDIYDAHVCSSAVPCPATIVPVPECQSSDACKAGPAPEPGIFGPPPSATFAGAGNIAPKPVSAVKVKKKKKAVKKHRPSKRRPKKHAKKGRKATSSTGHSKIGRQ